jgi:UPA domain
MVLACPPGCMPNKPDAEELANAVYREASTAPFLAKFVVFAKRTSLTSGQLKIFCVVIDDDDIPKLVDEEGFEEVARSNDIEVRLLAKSCGFQVLLLFDELTLLFKA